MRLLDKQKIDFETFEYDASSGAIDGVHVADELGKKYSQVFKTLVTVSDKNENFVFMIPVDLELDLKKAAKAMGVKSLAMLASKNLLPLTGYMRGGCSPLGMKKIFKTVIHNSVNKIDTIMFSAGKIGHQIEMRVCDLDKVLDYVTEFVVKDQIKL